MLEITSTRHNALIDPVLAVWSWEIPLYLFVGGIVAGMMVLGGIAMVRIAKGEDSRSFFSMQTPLFAFMLLNAGMGALFLDLTHKLYVWRIYTTFQVTSPMSWGSWVLLLVYAVLLVSALIRLPEVWPWLGKRVPRLQQLSAGIVDHPGRMKTLGWTNIALGVGIGIYTGILLNTMVARPLWNSAILGPLFLFSGMSAGAAMMHIASVVLPADRPAPQGMIGGAISAMIQPLGPKPPERSTVVALIRVDVFFLVVELILIGLLLANLLMSSASHIEAAALITTGAYAWHFWGVIVVAGVLLPIVLQGLELSHRIPHTIVPALLVLVGGYTLRWVMVNAGQASVVVHAGF
jgi:formate-dependent nitrite reductase membrane component NrfD